MTHWTIRHKLLPDSRGKTPQCKKCGDPPRSRLRRGLCPRCYEHHRIRGGLSDFPLVQPRRPAGLKGKALLRWIARQCLETTCGCLEWQGYREKDGYGEIRYQEKMWKAHRLIWNLTYGTIPLALHVLHHCDNPRCLNPEHLFLGTHSDNMADKTLKGRQANMRGNRNPSAILNQNDIPKIRQHHSAGETYITIAKRFGVCPSTVGQIIRREKWAHVT